MERIASDANNLDHPPYSSDKQHTSNTTFPQQRKSSHDKSEQAELQPNQNPKIDQKKFLEYCQRKGKFKFTKCSVCKKSVSHVLLSTHIKSHKNFIKILKCKYKACATFFLTDAKRQQHEEKIHNGRGKKECIFCGLFYSPSFIMNHIKEYHKEVIRCDFHPQCPKYFPANWLKRTSTFSRCTKWHQSD